MALNVLARCMQAQAMQTLLNIYLKLILEIFLSLYTHCMSRLNKYSNELLARGCGGIRSFQGLSMTMSQERWLPCRCCVGSGQVLDTGRCRVDTGRCRVDTGRCRVDTGRCLVDKGSCWVDIGRCQVDTGRCRVDMGRCRVDTGRCWVDTGRCRVEMVVAG